MKRILLLIITIFFMVSNGKSQTMFGNTALTLKKNVVSIGVNAMYATDINHVILTYAPSPESVAYFFHLGYGMTKTSDIGLNIGNAWGKIYYGFDLEKNFVSSGKFFMSGSLGGHYWNRAGADIDIIASLKISDFYLTSGFDIDLEPYKHSDGTVVLYLPAYVPVELEFNPTSRMAFSLEVDIAVNSPAFTTVGAGVNFYFK
jgi:hypothetical protein